MQRYEIARKKKEQGTFTITFGAPGCCSGQLVLLLDKAMTMDDHKIRKKKKKKRKYKEEKVQKPQEDVLKDDAHVRRTAACSSKQN